MTIRLRGLPFKTEEDDIIKFFHPLQPIEVRRRYLARRGVLRPIFYLVLVRGALPGTVASRCSTHMPSLRVRVCLRPRPRPSLCPCPCSCPRPRLCLCLCLCLRLCLRLCHARSLANTFRLPLSIADHLSSATRPPAPVARRRA